MLINIVNYIKDNMDILGSIFIILSGCWFLYFFYTEYKDPFGFVCGIILPFTLGYPLLLILGGIIKLYLDLIGINK